MKSTSIQLLCLFVFCLAYVMLCIGGCEPQEEATSRRTAAQSRATQDLVYFKDHRTNICFAGYSMPWASGLLGAVPCTPEVEKLIKE